MTLKQAFIDKANNYHNYKFSYNRVKYINSITDIEIECPIHGYFWQRPSNHLRCDCPECSKVTIKNKISKSEDQCLIDFYCKHGDGYNYKLVEYKGNKVKVDIICNKCKNTFPQKPANHLNGQGCPYCYGTSLKDTNQFISECNGKKSIYRKSVYINNKTKIELICPIHGSYWQYPNDHQYKGCGCPDCTGRVSKQEQELQDWLSQYIDIKCNDRTLISPLELDIVIPSKRITIEYNGLYWHSEQQGKDINYHLNKYNLCKDKGYRLIQIWENEWLLKKDIVKSIILNAIGKHTDKVHGRKCEIRTITPKEARPFYDDNHIQGFKGGKHHGLYYRGDLVSLMTIDKRNELQRFVNKRNTIVHGAFSKLLKSFNLDYIYTFADLRYFTGDVYKNNGFELKYQIKPSFYYFRTSNNTLVYHRRMFQKKNQSQKLEFFDDSLTSNQNMINNGYHRIWDCGNLKFEIKKS